MYGYMPYIKYIYIYLSIYIFIYMPVAIGTGTGAWVKAPYKVVAAAPDPYRLGAPVGS